MAPAAAVLEAAVQAPEVVVRVLEVAQAVVEAPEVVELEAAATVVVLAVAVLEAREVVVLEVAATVVVLAVVLAAEAQVRVEPAVAAVQVLAEAVLAPEVALLAVALLAVAQVAEAQVAEAQVRVDPVAALQAEVAQPPGPAEPVRVARPVQAPVETAPLVAMGRRVRSVHRTLPVLPARALPQAVALPAGRRRMGRPLGQPVRRQALGAGRGATSWRPLPVRKCAAPTSCVPCTSGAMPSRAQPIA